MAEHHCPECGFEGVRRAEALALDWVRFLSGDSRRYCPRCNARWKSHRLSSRRIAAAALIVLAAGAAVKSLEPVLRRGTSKLAGVRDSPGTPPADGLAPELGPDDRASSPGDPLADDGSPAAAKRPSQGRPPGLHVEIVRNQDSWFMKQARFLAMAFGIGGAPSGSKMDQLLQEDKHQLWNQYGQYFSSKQQAQQAYNQAQADRTKAKAKPQAPPED